MYLVYTLGYNPVLYYLFLFRITPVLATESSSRWILCPFDMPHPCGFQADLHWQALQDFSRLVLCFPWPALDRIISARSPASFYWWMAIKRSRIWAMGTQRHKTGARAFVLPGGLMNHLHLSCITQGTPAEVTKWLDWGCDGFDKLGGKDNLAFSQLELTLQVGRILSV